MKNTSMRLRNNFFTSILLIGFLWPVMGLGQVLSPQTHGPYTAYIQNNEDEARVGEPFFILLGLEPETLPIGYSLSILVDVIERPDGVKPDILTGFPKIRMTMMQAGLYRIIVRGSLMSKSSCGGIDAEEILREELRFQVVEL